MDQALAQQRQRFPAGSSNDQEANTRVPSQLPDQDAGRRIATGHDQGFVGSAELASLRAATGEQAVVLDEAGLRRFRGKTQHAVADGASQ